MKRLIMTILGVGLLAALPLIAADDPSSEYKKFYGKIIALDADKNEMTVSNKRKKLEADFSWSDETKMVFDKKSVSDTILKIGQNLIITYSDTDGSNQIQRLTVRKPYKRKTKT